MPENLPAIVGEFGIVMVPTSRRRRPGETHAKAKLRDILLQLGEVHLRAPPRPQAKLLQLETQTGEGDRTSRVKRNDLGWAA